MHVLLLAFVAFLVFVHVVWRPYRAERRRLADIRRAQQILHPHLTPAQVEAEVNLYRR